MPRSDTSVLLGADLSGEISGDLERIWARSSISEMQLWGSGAIAELESKIAGYYGTRYALCVSNATTGLLAIALALDLTRSEFITGAYGYGASLASWLLLGCKPVFADVDRLTLTVDPEHARRLVTAKTKSILAVDVFGNPSDMLSLRELADEFDLRLIADCAQSFGATRLDRPAGKSADALVISFTSGKTLFAGEGGAIVTDNSDLYEKLVFFSQHPYRQKRELGRSIVNEFGINGRIHPLAAIWANCTFERSLETLKSHQDRCFKFIDLINKSDFFRPIDLDAEQIVPTFFQLTAELHEDILQTDVDRRLSKVMLGLASAPVSASVFYQNPGFRAQFSRRFHLPRPCVVAEQQARNRVAIVFPDNEVHSASVENSGGLKAIQKETI